MEVRRGYSTDTFNEAVRGAKKVFASQKCFSLIFDHRVGGQNLDLVCPDSKSRKGGKDG